MRKRPQNSSVKPPESSAGESSGAAGADERSRVRDNVRIKTSRSGFVWLTLFVLIVYSSWAVYRYQFENLPAPLTAEQAGKRGFSEVEAVKHVKALTELGPHSVGSDALDLALQYVLKVAEKIKKTAHWEVDVEVDFFHANTSANRMVGGLFKGKTLVYSDLKHVVLRIMPKYVAEAEDNAILVSSHIDTVFSGEGAADCSSCVAVMLELARGISQWAHGFKNSVIFLFNTGEEEGLNGAHSFITQHPLRGTIRTAIDLESMGIGGKSVLFQAGPDPWAIENFASVAKYPTAQILAQDLFSFGIIKSATDFQVYKEVAGLSGLDFACTDNTAVYHTKNDKFELLKSGSLQHSGENMLAYLLHIGSSSQLSKLKAGADKEKTQDDAAVYFDIMGTYLVVYRQGLSRMLHNSVILQSLLIWTTSIFMGGYPAAVSLAVSCLSIILMWIFSLSFSALVAYILPLVSPSPVPYIASPLLVVGLFAAPAFLGALIGQHLGFLILQKYLSSVYSTRKLPSPDIQADLVKSEAERWLFKAGSMQWLVLLLVGTYYKIGSTYMALVWLVPPTFAYGLLEATLSPVRLPRPLKLATLLIGLALPILFSAGIFIKFAGLLIGMAVRFDRNPGGTPEWLGSLVVAVFIAAVICLTLTYILSYVHISGAKSSIILATCILFCLSLAAVLSGVFPAFTEDTARAVNVVHVVDSTGGVGEKPSSYMSFSSLTPGKLTKEIEQIQEGFVCGRDKEIDFVTFSVKYGCLSFDNTEDGWSDSDIPTLNVASDTVEDKRTTQVSIDTKSSTRWTLGINTEEVDDFVLKVDMEELVPLGNKTSVDGWHTIQFSGGKNAPTKFDLSLFWVKNYTKQPQGENVHPLLKLRTDVDRVTPKAERVLSKLPPWCSLFGKSTSPHTLAFLSRLPVVF